MKSLVIIARKIGTGWPGSKLGAPVFDVRYKRLLRIKGSEPMLYDNQIDLCILLMGKN